jgi:flagellar protein FlbD
MIELTSLSGNKLWINPHQIETMEAKPDTILVFVYGKTIVVAEKPEEVVAKIVAYRARIASCVLGEGASGFGESD